VGLYSSCNVKSNVCYFYQGHYCCLLLAYLWRKQLTIRVRPRRAAQVARTALRQGPNKRLFIDRAFWFRFRVTAQNFPDRFTALAIGRHDDRPRLPRQKCAVGLSWRLRQRPAQLLFANARDVSYNHEFYSVTQSRCGYLTYASLWT